MSSTHPYKDVGGPPRPLGVRITLIIIKDKTGLACILIMSCKNNHEHNILNNYYTSTKFQSQQSSSNQAHEQT